MTEKRYFDMVERQLRTVNVKVVASHRDPGGLVEKARALLDADAAEAADHHDQGNRWDRVYVVTDVDEFAPQLTHLQDRVRLEGIDLVVSNPCFEVWLVCYQARPVADGRGVRQQARDLGLVTGPRGKDPVLGRLEDFDRAERMARELRAAHQRNGVVFPHDAPSTRVDEVVRFLRDKAAESS
ncbi:MAG: RloB family protein [Micrococcales bacterium]|nr:RloB family protein [Micrococcales bacterium]